MEETLTRFDGQARYRRYGHGPLNYEPNCLADEVASKIDASGELQINIMIR